MLRAMQAPGAPNRTETTENFPTASLLLAPRVRAQVLAFYRFVRTADDIADSPALDAAEKLRRLDAMEAALDDPATALPEAAAMHARGVGVEEARRMLSAFRQDATTARYADWAELADYCTRSADPVGRMLLRLHGDLSDESAHAADGLCSAMQVLNHVQDAQEDRAKLGRVYIPQGWMGDEDAFFAQATPHRRAVLDALLDRVEDWLDQAAALPRLCRDRRLSWQSAMTLACGRRLLARLRAADPLAGRVALGRADFAAALVTPPPSDSAVVAARVRRAGSSFAAGMAALRGGRRRALWAVYAFCRAVDDVADGAMPEFEKRRLLSRWREKLDEPDCALSRELAWACREFAIPRAECEAMIAGMETDAADTLRLPDEAALDLYCRRVAGSVGAMSVRIFGAPGAEAWGLALGHTFQLTNILRDVDEDARRDRVYIPRSLLDAAGIPDGPAAEVTRHPAFAGICEALAERAVAGYAQAGRELGRHDAAALKPARVMMWAYSGLLDHMLRRGWDAPRPRVRLAPSEKVCLAALALLPTALLPPVSRA